jgi:hypothetical protein
VKAVVMVEDMAKGAVQRLTLDAGREGMVVSAKS